MTEEKYTKISIFLHTIFNKNKPISVLITSAFNCLIKLTRHGAGQPCQALPAGSADADQEGAAARHRQHPADLRQVFQGVLEQHDVHLALVRGVVLVEAVLGEVLERLQVRHLLVFYVVLGRVRVHVGAEHEVLHGLVRDLKGRKATDKYWIGNG